MKKIKKLLLLGAAFLATASLAFGTACGNEGDDSSTDFSSSSSTQSSQTETQSYYKTIINGKKVDVTPTGEDNFYLGATVTVNVPSAGTYVVNSTDGAAFGDNTPDTETDSVYTFTATAAGDYTFKVSYFDMSGAGSARVTYYVYEMTKAPITEAGGAVKLLANVNAAVSFTAAKAGRYRIVTNTDYNFYLGASDSEGVYSKTFIVETTADNQSVDFFVRCDNGLESFKFTYTVEDANAVAVQSGENTKTLYSMENNLFSFTAATAGEYKITTSATGVSFGQYDATLGEPNFSKAETYFEGGVAKSAFVFTANANEAVLFYAKSYDSTSEVTFTISPWTEENKYPSEIKLQSSDMTINMKANGATSATLNVTGSYAISWSDVDNDAQTSTPVTLTIGSQTFTSGTLLLNVKENTALTFNNPTGEAVKVKLSYSENTPLTFEAYIAADDTEKTTINYATRVAEDKSFLLTWTGEGTLYKGETAYTDGTTGIVFDGVNKNMHLLAQISAQTETKLVFTITEIVTEE